LVFPPRTPRPLPLALLFPYIPHYASRYIERIKPGLFARPPCLSLLLSPPLLSEGKSRRPHLKSDFGSSPLCCLLFIRQDEPPPKFWSGDEMSLSRRRLFADRSFGLNSSKHLTLRLNSHIPRDGPSGRAFLFYLGTLAG